MKRILAAFICTVLATFIPAHITSANSQSEALFTDRAENKNLYLQSQTSIFNSVNEIVPRSPAARVAKQFLQSLEAQDTNAIAQLWAEDAALEAPYDLEGREFPNREAAQGYIEGVVGLFNEIRFEPSKEKPPEIVSRAEVGLSPEGFALSPDNSLIATVNMRRTYLPFNFPPVWRGKPYSSLSLVQFDKSSGKLTTLQEYGFEGLLPEQASFDADGKSLAVVIYNYREQSPTTGAVEFWNVVGGNKPSLERTGFKIDVVRGAHDITLVR